MRRGFRHASLKAPFDACLGESPDSIPPAHLAMFEKVEDTCEMDEVARRWQCDERQPRTGQTDAFVSFCIAKSLTEEVSTWSRPPYI